MNGGQLISGVENPDQCKAACLVDEDCEAVDFNSQLQTCISHNADDMESYAREENPQFDHFHKTKCKLQFFFLCKWTILFDNFHKTECKF